MTENPEYRELLARLAAQKVERAVNELAEHEQYFDSHAVAIMQRACDRLMQITGKGP